LALKARNRRHDPDEPQDAGEDVAELPTAPRVDKTSGPLHRVPERFRRPDEVLRDPFLDAKNGDDVGNHLATRVGR